MSEEIIYLRGEGGVVRPHKLPLPEGIADRLAKGYIRRVNEDGTEWQPEADAEHDPQQGTSVPKRPPVSAQKAAWVAWAVEQGADPDAADAMTKPDLIEKYG